MSDKFNKMKQHLINQAETVDFTMISDEADHQPVKKKDEIKKNKSFINDANWDKNKIYKNRNDYEKAQGEYQKRSADKLLNDILKIDMDKPEYPVNQESLQKRMDQKMAIADKLMEEKIKEEENKGKTPDNNAKPSVESQDVLQEKLNTILENYLSLQREKTQIEKEVSILKSLQEGNNTAEKSGENIDQNNLNNNEPNRETVSESIDDIVAILKNEKIDQIIVAGDNYNEEKDFVSFSPDLDTKIALYLLNNLNKKTLEETYTEGAVSSVIGKGGEGKDKIENNKGGKLYPLEFENGQFNKDGNGKEILKNENGVKIFLDTGGEWIKVVQNGKEKTIYIDHHGSGKREATSGTKLMYEIMKKAGILEEKPWVKNLVDFVDDVDNLSYVNTIDKNGNKLFTENYLRNTWPSTLYALAENNIPAMGIIKLFESGKIKDYTKPFTKEELLGEIGNIEIGEKDGKKILLRKFINPSVIKKLEDQIKKDIDKIRIVSKYNLTVEKLNLDSKKLGKIMYQNFGSVKNLKSETGDKKTRANIFDNWLAFKIIKARGLDTLITWNKKQKYFFINSTKGDLVEIAKKLNEVDPGCIKQGKDIRGMFIFGKIQNLTEQQFLEILDPEILKPAK